MRICSLLKCLQPASRFDRQKVCLIPWSLRVKGQIGAMHSWSFWFSEFRGYLGQWLALKKGFDLLIQFWSQSQTLLHRKWPPLDTSIYNSIVSDTVQVTIVVVSWVIICQSFWLQAQSLICQTFWLQVHSLIFILTASSESNLSIILTARSEPNSSIILTASSESENLG